MQKAKHQLVIQKDDYDIMIDYLRGKQGKTLFDRHNADELQMELKKAKVVNKENFPPDVVRLNSRVMIQEEDKGKVMEVMLVTPDKADIKQRKISVLAPIGTALIGFRKGQKVTWLVPSGKKVFTILDVINE